jgi:hypothetical protein
MDLWVQVLFGFAKRIGDDTSCERDTGAIEAALMDAISQLIFGYGPVEGTMTRIPGRTDRSQLD